jgi:hypothetical protein
MFEQDALARATRAHEDEDFAGFHRERDPFQNLERAEGFRQILDRDITAGDSVWVKGLRVTSDAVDMVT